jgi:nifR3 family TIM-barrel protein
VKKPTKKIKEEKVAAPREKLTLADKTVDGKTSRGEMSLGETAPQEKTSTFWQKLPRPFFVLAPMANVTDAAFRRIIAKYGKPDVTWTEFVSADGLMSPGREVLLRDLEYSGSERPIVAQLFTGHPDKMKQAAAIAKKLGFDGVDINMGCPDRAVEKQGGGAAMIKNKESAKAVIEAAREGASPLPVSVKTRIGYNKNQIDEWIVFLLEQKLPALTVHLRTRKEMSDVPAHWEIMKDIVSLRDKISPRTLIIGNGDIQSIEQAREKVKETGCDGVMIGRGIFGNPWCFSGKIPTTKEKIMVLIEHTNLFEKLLGDIKNFAIMKKHFKAYISGWEGAKELRMQLMETNSAGEVEKILKNYLKDNVDKF